MNNLHEIFRVTWVGMSGSNILGVPQPNQSEVKPSLSVYSLSFWTSSLAFSVCSIFSRISAFDSLAVSHQLGYLVENVALMWLVLLLPSRACSSRTTLTMTSISTCPKKVRKISTMPPVCKGNVYNALEFYNATPAMNRTPAVHYAWQTAILLSSTTEP